MPRVPYDPVPQTAVQDDFARGPQVETPGAAFGTNIAEAIKGGGQTLAQLGAHYQAIGDEANAREASIAATQDMAMAQSKFDMLEGAARSEGLMRHLQDLNNIRQKYKGTLSLNAGQLYDAEAASLMNRFTAASAARAGDGLKEQAVTSARAHMDVVSNQWVDASNEKEWNEKQKQILPAARTEAENTPGGFTEDKYNDIVQKRMSKLWTDRIGIMMRTDVDKGFTLLNTARVKNEILPDDDKRIYDALIDKNREVASRYIADTAYSPKKSLQQALDDGKELAADPQLSHGDPLFAGRVETAIRGRYGLDNYVIKQQTNEDKNAVQQAIAKSVASGQTLDAAGLAASDPNLQAAIVRLKYSDPAYVNGLDKTIQKFYDDKHRTENDRNFETFVHWRYSDPLRFMQEDVNQYGMSDKQRNKILAEKQAVAKDPNGDPRVTQAIGYLQANRRGDLQALGIFNKPKPDEFNADWGKYVAALEGGIQAWTETHNNQSPGYKDIVDVIGPQAISKVGVVHMFGFTTHPEEIPQATLDNARKELNKTNPEVQPTDDELRQGVYRQQFLDLYSKDKTSGGSTTTKSRSAGPV